MKAFNDGYCDIYVVEKRKIGDKIGRFNFKEETVGIQSYTQFETLGIEIEKVISIPYNNLITNGRVLNINGGEQFYQISLVQIKDTTPKSLKLTLSGTPLRWDND